MPVSGRQIILQSRQAKLHDASPTVDEMIAPPSDHEGQTEEPQHATLAVHTADSAAKSNAHPGDVRHTLSQPTKTTKPSGIPSRSGNMVLLSYSAQRFSPNELWGDNTSPSGSDSKEDDKSVAENYRQSSRQSMYHVVTDNDGEDGYCFSS